MYNADRMEEASSNIEVTVKTLDSLSRSYTVEAQVSWIYFYNAHCHVSFMLVSYSVHHNVRCRTSYVTAD